jgi:TetR/AcrR family transcriptional repressor of nem operon
MLYWRCQPDKPNERARAAAIRGYIEVVIGREHEMTKGEDTRARIIEQSAPLFNKQGYAGTALSDLMDATGLQKGGIYRHFASKEELAAEAFDYAWRKAVEVRAHGVEATPNAVDRLERMIENFVELRTGLVPGGCPLLNTAIDSDDGNTVMRERARGALRNWQARLAKIVKQGLKERQIRKGIEPDELAGLVISQLEGALMMSRLNQSRQPLEWAQAHLTDYLETRVRAS